MRYIYRTAWLLATLFAIGACNVGEESKEMQRADVEAIVNRELEQGDSRAEIEAFLNRHGIKYTFDDYMKRYQCLISDTGRSYHAIRIYIYIDERDLFKEADIRDLYDPP
jgi:hypothetical protein